jgi:hypothetical protein
MTEPRAPRNPLDISCTYHKGARHTLRGCRLRKKIDWERNAPHSTRTPTSPDVGEFQKVQVHISPNDQSSIRWRVLVVLANEPPRVSAMDSEEARQIQGNANRAQRRAEEQRQVVPLCTRDLRLEFEEAGLPTFNSPQANLGAPMACLYQANPSPEAEAAMAYLRVATALVEEKSMTSKSTTSSSSRHSLSQSNRPAHIKLPTIQEEVDRPQQMVRKTTTYAPTSTRTGVATMLAATSINAIASAKRGSSDVVWTTIASTVLC